MSRMRPAPKLTRRHLLGAGAATAAGLSLPTLAGCKDSGSSESGSGSKTVAYSSYLTGTFFSAVRESIKRRAQDHGYKFTSTEANGDSSNQFSQVKSALLTRPRFLLIDPADSENLIPATKTAKTDKVPVGVVDSPLSGGNVAITVVFNNKMAGELAGQKIVELLKKKHGSAKGTVLEPYGSLTSLALRDRKSGFESVIKKHPGIKLIARPQKNDPQQVLSIITSAIREYPDLDALHMPTDAFMDSVVRGLTQAGHWTTDDDSKHILFVSMDGDPKALQYLKQGYMDADVSQDPIAYGQIAFDMLEKYSVTGKSVPLGDYSDKDYFWEKAKITDSPSGPLLTVPAYFITKDNSSDPRQWGNVFTEKWGLKA